MIANRRLSARARRLCCIVAAGLGIAAVIALHDDFGTTADEPAHAKYGELARDYFASGLSDTSCNRFSNFRFYGPLMDMLPALLYGERSAVKYEIRHLLLGLLALLIPVVLWRYGDLLGGWEVGLCSAALLFGLPRFMGHVFFNSKDIPFALGVAWFAYLLAKWATQAAPSWRTTAGCVLTLGFALSVRPGGMPLLLVYLLAAAALAVVALSRERGLKRSLSSVGLRLCVVVVGAWTLMVGLWPWAHQAVVRHPLRAMTEAASFSFTYRTLFEGAYVNSDQLPWYYLPKFILISTPVTTLAMATIGLAYGAWRVWRAPRDRFTAAFLVVAIWLVVPLVAFMALRPNVYDGLRHFLFLLPALALLGGLGTWKVAHEITRRIKAQGSWPPILVLCGLLLAVLLPALLQTVRLHPYQYTYFNAAVGGLRGAEGRYETDYWLASYREGIEWINQRTRTRARSKRKTVVAVAGARETLACAGHYAAKNVVVINAGEVGPGGYSIRDVDYYLSTTRYQFHRAVAQAPVVHRVQRQGALFAVVRDLRRVVEGQSLDRGPTSRPPP